MAEAARLPFFSKPNQVDTLQAEAYRSGERTHSKGSTMRYAEILSQSAIRSNPGRTARAHTAHCHIHRARVSRRQFIQGAAGLTAFAATFGSSVSRAEGALRGPGIGLVTPIPTTLSIFGQHFHVQAPPFTGVNSDPSSVYNFRGTAGIAFISGFVERTDRKTGETRMLPYSFNDMRFMQGRFEGRDGHVRNGTFVFT